MTPLALIRLALRDGGINGVGQTPSDEENNDTFTHLNMMLAGWNRKRWLVFHLIDVACTATGATSYTIGTGCDFNTPRPDRLESAFGRYLGASSPNQVDWPIEVLDAREDYNRITMKSLMTSATPNVVFYDPAFPVGILHFWPSPSAGSYELHVSVKSALTQFTDLVTDIALPDEYLEALVYNLAVRARIMFRMKPDAGLDAIARQSLNTIRMANTQIPRLMMPGAVMPRRTRYNIYSDGGV